MHISNALTIATVAAASSNTSHWHSQRLLYPDCVDIVFSLQGSTRAVVSPTAPLPIYYDLNATFNINARYCEPATRISGPAESLQVLVHGITYNRNYWSGLDFPGFHGNNYSWISYAAERGYPTLSIDRLGHGLSDHPDPISVVQNQIQVELMHALIEQIRNGSVLPMNYTNIIYVGHSQGSLIGKAYTDRYPADINALILTGWTTIPPNGAIVFPGLSVASTLHQRFEHLEPGYVTGVNASARAPFYSVPGQDYDPEILRYDFVREDVYTIGTAFTTPNQTIISNFTGPVFLMTGQLDRVFCGSSGDCGTGSESVLAQEARYFPTTRNFDFFCPAHTGHNLNFHYTQFQSFQKAHDWLEKFI